MVKMMHVGIEIQLSQYLRYIDQAEYIAPTFCSQSVVELPERLMTFLLH